jgi:hypothetical protein
MKAVKKTGGKNKDWRKGRKKENSQNRDERHAMKQLRWELANHRNSEGSPDVSDMSTKELAEKFRKKRSTKLKSIAGGVLGAGAAAVAASAYGSKDFRKK